VTKGAPWVKEEILRYKARLQEIPWVVEAVRAAGQIAVIFQALMLSMVEAAGLERIQRRRGLAAVLSTAAVAAGLDIHRGRPPVVAMVAPGEVIRLALAVLEESMMAMVELMEHQESSDVAMAAAAAAEAHLLAWDSAVTAERQVEAVQVVEEEQA